MKSLINSKRNLFITAICLSVSAFCITSCEKDEEDTSIIGKWVSEKTVSNRITNGNITDTETKTYTTSDEQYVIVEFKSDLTYNVKYPNDTSRHEYGKYLLSGSKISITALSDGNETNTYNYEISDNTLKITDTDKVDNDNVTIETIKYLKRL